jgi:hypothetical protein
LQIVLRALVLLLVPTFAFANMGAPTRGTGAASEPAGTIDVAITREQLVIDLRPIAEGKHVEVAATYQVDNRDTTKQLSLVFAAGSDFDVLRVTLDGKPVETRPVDSATLPQSWQPPNETPTADGKSLGFSLPRGMSAAGFQLELPPGPHEIAIAFSTSAMTHHAKQPVLQHQFVYMLAPARTWLAFGGLDVTVHLPHEWEATITPAMKRTGDTFTASFPNLPADAIAMTTSAPLGSYRYIVVALWVLFVLVAIGGGFLVHRVAFVLQRWHSKSNRVGSPGVTAFFLGIAWAAAFLAAAILALFGADFALPANEVDHRGYGDALAAVFFGFVSLLVVVLGFVLGKRGARRATPELL